MRINPISFSYDRSVRRFDRVQNPFIQPMKCDSVHFTGNTVQSKKVIMLLGAPNSGKGTFGRELAKKYAIPQISTGDILRNEVKNATALGAKAKSFMDSGGLVPNELIMEIFEKRIAQDDCKRGFILDGFPRTIDQAQDLDIILKRDKNIDLKIVNLDVDTNILFQRCVNRYICEDCSKTHSLKDGHDANLHKCDCGGKLIKRADDTPKVFAQRLSKYKTETFPLIEYYGNKVKNVTVYGADVPAEKTLSKVLYVLEN